MSKAKAATKAEKEIHAVYYRAVRTSTYAWQPYRLTIFSDGSMVEDIPIKEDVLHITLSKLGGLMKQEGHALFELQKAKRIKAENLAR